jgi:hypothetical protein
VIASSVGLPAEFVREILERAEAVRREAGAADVSAGQLSCCVTHLRLPLLRNRSYLVGWEKRERGGRYYTRSLRENGCVVREYVGGGLVGEMASEADRIERERREAEERHHRREIECLEAFAAPVEELHEAAAVLALAHLIAAGYHRRKGEYRRAKR